MSKPDSYIRYCIFSEDDNLILRIYKVDSDDIFDLDNQVDIPVLDILLKLCALHLSEDDVNTFLKGVKNNESSCSCKGVQGL